MSSYSKSNFCIAPMIYFLVFFFEAVAFFKL